MLNSYKDLIDEIYSEYCEIDRGVYYEVNIVKNNDNINFIVIKDYKYTIFNIELLDSNNEGDMILSFIKEVAKRLPYYYLTEDIEFFKWLCSFNNDISLETERNLDDQDMLIHWAKDVASMNINGYNIKEEILSSIKEGKTIEEKIAIAAVIAAGTIISDIGYSRSYKDNDTIKRNINIIRSKLLIDGILIVEYNNEGEKFSVSIYDKDFCHHELDGKSMIVSKEDKYICSLCGAEFTSLDL